MTLRVTKLVKDQAHALPEVAGAALSGHSVGKRVQKRQYARVDIFEGFYANEPLNNVEGCARAQTSNSIILCAMGQLGCYAVARKASNLAK